MIDKNFKNRLFGRTRGRSKKNINIENYLEKLNDYKFDKFDDYKKYILDIGTGHGETTLYLAKKYSNFKIIACEKYIDGNLKLIKEIKTKKLNNIYIHNGNVNEILDESFIEKKFHKVWIFFPDPWPKKKHHKRRLITKDFLNKLYPLIEDDGEICIVTDSSSYFRFILRQIFEIRKLYIWKNQSKLYLNLKDYFDLETKYYKKAIISARKPSLLILKKL